MNFLSEIILKKLRIISHCAKKKKPFCRVFIFYRIFGIYKEEKTKKLVKSKLNTVLVVVLSVFMSFVVGMILM